MTEIGTHKKTHIIEPVREPAHQPVKEQPVKRKKREKVPA